MEGNLYVICKPFIILIVIVLYVITFGSQELERIRINTDKIAEN